MIARFGMMVLHVYAWGCRQPFRYQGLSYRLLQGNERWAVPRFCVSVSNLKITCKNVETEHSHNSYSKKRCVFILL